MKFSGKKRILFILIGVVAALFAACGVYLGNYYHSVDVERYLAGTDEVAVEEFEYGLFFDGAGEGSALIFYPGAKVETDAYAPLMYEFAENGVDCFLVDMPFHMAFFDMGRAKKVMALYDYGTWYLGGHSLGGAMAANFAAEHTEEFDGLLLLAAYPTKDLSDADFPVLTAYGSNDGVVNLDKIAAARALLPPGSAELVIEGGNHANFGSYGAQKGDNDADISAAEQRTQTVEAFLELVGK